MTYNYYQTEGGEEVWKAIPTDKLDTISNAMFVTILSVETPLADNMEKEELAAIKYKGPLYFDLDDSESPASTAVHTRKLISKLEDLGVLPEMLQVYASGGKGFHITVPEACFLTKPPKSGLTLLPAIFKEMAFQLAVPSLDLRVYTARKGRMFRQKNVLRPNGNYKVQLTMQDLEFLVKEAARNTADAEAHYKVLCSTPSAEMESQTPALAMGLLALFDQCKSKVTKAASSRKKQKKTVLPDTLPSFEAMLRGEGIKSDVGFHQLAMQIAITAHAKGMDKKTLLEAADGLCKTHESDSARYGSESKRRAELDRMWEYTDDNPCYTYNAGAITGLLTHSAPDLRGLEVSDAEVAAGIENPSDGLMVDDPYDHAGVILTERGAFTMTENGPKRILALGFENVTELVSATTNTLSVISADVNMGGRSLGRKTMELDAFNSVTNFNKITMPYGQSFSGSDTQARGMMMRLVEKARKNRNRMYVLGREGLDIVSMPFHEDEEVRRDFLVWSDVKSVTPEPAMIEKDVKMKFVGFPDENGQFRTDLSLAPSLPAWLKEDGNKELLRNVMQNLLHCQKPAHLGKLIGWMVACNYRMLFHKVYTKFPLLHINGSAGQGKTEMTLLMSNFHYYKQTPKMLTPTSTLFAVSYAAAGSASIPLILDEFKPGEMRPDVYDRFKLMLRDAYNCRSVERGGGNRESSDYRAVHTTALSAPLCFIAEAAESESALMERVVLLTLTKPPVVQAQEFFHKFSSAMAHKEVLGIVGGYMAAQIVQRYSVEDLKTEFDVVYNEARKELMLQEGEVNTLSNAEFMKKSGAKERTVFNYSVVKFGLIKLRNLITNIYPKEFDDIFADMIEHVYSTVEDIQTQTIPEWLKVLNNLADMTKVDSMAQFYLKEGGDYAIIEYNGKTCLELYVRSFYLKYRMYAAAGRNKPLFPSEAAFVHALNNLPSLEASGLSQELDVPGGSHILDLDELRGAGFIAPG